MLRFRLHPCSQQSEGKGVVCSRRQHPVPIPDFEPEIRIQTTMNDTLRGL